MCLLCADPGADPSTARRAHILHLLALVEHPDALPPDAGLRLGREIMALIQAEPGERRCDAVDPPETTTRTEEMDHARDRS
ncbi:MAG: hypothetical protein ACRYF2_06610 [Janthinobacterium lividum]